MSFDADQMKPRERVPGMLILSGGAISPLGVTVVPTALSVAERPGERPRRGVVLCFNEPGETPVDPRSGDPTLYFQVEHVDRLIAELQLAKAQIESVPVDAFPPDLPADAGGVDA